VIDEGVFSIGGMMLTAEKRSTRRKYLYQCQSFRH